MMERNPSIEGAVIRGGTPRDLPEILSLLAQAGLIITGVEDHLSQFVVAESGDRIVGSAGLEVYGDAALLRSVAVAASLRGRGLGARLVRETLSRARRQGVRQVALLTTSATTFFHRFGFREVDRAALDTHLAASPELGDECCATAVAMVLSLAREGRRETAPAGWEERV